LRCDPVRFIVDWLINDWPNVKSAHFTRRFTNDRVHFGGSLAEVNLVDRKIDAASREWRSLRKLNNVYYFNYIKKKQYKYDQGRGCT
jgi:hypothetical protein